MIESYLAPSNVIPHYEAWPTITLYTGHMHVYTQMHIYGKIHICTIHINIYKYIIYHCSINTVDTDSTNVGFY